MTHEHGQGDPDSEYDEDLPDAALVGSVDLVEIDAVKGAIKPA